VLPTHRDCNMISAWLAPTATQMLTRFWFKFSPLPPSPLNLGCGVTAHDYDDAISLLKQSVFVENEIPTIVEVITNVDVSTLDQGHVAPNMEVPIFRGVWFPQGYAFETSN
jgi:hypothetical protein